MVINQGLDGLRKSGRPAGPAVVTGVLCSLFVGTVALAVANRGQLSIEDLDLAIVFGGLLTFPIGTGLYYFTAVAYQDRAEVSSQYANVKPAISIAIGTLIFGETFGGLELAVSLLIGCGIAVILWDGIRRRRGLLPAALGLMLAIAWASGEGFIRAATDSHSSLAISFGALVSSLLMFGLAFGCYLVVAWAKPTWALHPATDFSLQRGHLAFCLHGLLSFGIAYTLFFHSIGLIGLSPTIMITVFWPSLALVFGILIARSRGVRYRIRRPLVLAFALFTCASISYVAVTLWSA